MFPVREPLVELLPVLLQDRDRIGTQDVGHPVPYAAQDLGLELGEHVALVLVQGVHQAEHFLRAAAGYAVLSVHIDAFPVV
ncbi:MAG TPA: hypothetical protein VF070_23750 [Streptosporangiaceae bacterium]